MSEEYTSGGYQMEMLKASNWMPWKWQMLVILWDLGLEKYIVADAKLPELADRSKPTPEELETQKKWQGGDTKACTWIELAISDAEMIHISGTMTVHEMWNQLSLVKESKGQLGVLASHWKGCTELRQNYTFIFKIIKISTQNYTISIKITPCTRFVLLGSPWKYDHFQTFK